MMLRRFELQPFQRLHNQVDRLFWGLGQGDARNGEPRGGLATPPVNVWEANDSLFVEAELPGVRAEDLDISVVENELTIKGQRHEQKTEGEASGSFHRRERSTGSFVRVLRLPADVKADAVKASLNAGVLLIELPKSEAAKHHKIEVKTS